MRTKMPLGRTDNLGNALPIRLNTDGTTALRIFRSAVTGMNTSAVPEPGMFAFFGVELAA